MQKGQTGILVLAGIVILLAVAGGVFYLGRITLPRQDSSGQAAPKPQPQNVVTSSPQPSPTPLPTTTSDETANWKTYTNNGYSVKYPDNLTLNTRNYKGLNGGLVTIDEWFNDKKDEIAVYSYAKGVIPGLEFNAQFKEEQILLAGINTNKFVSIDNTLIQIGPFENNNMGYMIVYTSGIQKPDHTIFNQILSTFRLLP